MNTMPSFRLHGGQQGRRRFWIAASLFGASAVACWFVGVVELTAFCSGAAATLLVVSGLITLPDEECAFCQRARAQVDSLVAAPHVSICEDCTQRSTAVLAEKSARTGGGRWLKHLALSLPPKCPRAVSSPVFRALAFQDAAERQALISQAFAVGNPEAVCELVVRVPEAERLPSDWINLGVALEHLGRFDEAISAVEHVAGLPDEEPWLLNNRGTARLEAQPPCDEATLRALLADNVRARDLLSAKKPPGFEWPLASMWGAAAELHRRLGQPEQVRRCVATAEKLRAPTTGLLLTQARLARDEGATEEARRLLTSALEAAHPESRDAEQARSLLNAL